MSTWYIKIKQMCEHITYEFRYEHLSSIRVWLNMHESTIYLITLIELFVHIDCEKHSLRVLTPHETTKDKLVKHVSIKITTYRVNSP